MIVAERAAQDRCSMLDREVTVNPSRKLRRFESFTRHWHSNGPGSRGNALRGPFPLCRIPGRWSGPTPDGREAPAVGKGTAAAGPVRAPSGLVETLVVKGPP